MFNLVVASRQYEGPTAILNTGLGRASRDEAHTHPEQRRQCEVVAQ